MAIAGIDIGTTGCKCTVYSTDGCLQSEAYEEYASEGDVKGKELDAWLVWQSVKNVIKRAAKDADEIAAIGVTSFGETSVFVGKNCRPLMNALVYTDVRGEEQCQKIVDRFGKDHIRQVTGINPQTMYSLSKWMWVVENRPDVYTKTDRIFLFGDYIVYLLSGVAQIDYSLACRTMAFDYESRQWNKELLDFAGVDIGKMSRPVPTGTKAGMIRKTLAEELGVSEKAVIVSGCHDQIAAAVGTGCLSPGMAVDGTGTVECITPVFHRPENIREMYKNNYVLIPYIKPETYVTYAFSFNGGSLLKWYRDKIAWAEADICKRNGKNAFTFFDEQVDIARPSGLLVLPYFSGSATPYMDSGARGAVVGLTDQTRSIDIYQALMEGVTYEMLFNLECLSKAGIRVEELRATGGGANAEIWLQMKANILNKRIISLGAAQSGTLGSIMMAGTACGLYASLDEAETVFVREEKVYFPESDMHAQYIKYYEKYKKMYSAISAIIR